MTEKEIDVVVSDEKMPGMGGSELLRIVRIKYPSTIRIMLTGCASVESAMNAIYEGWVYQYLHKPVDASDLASAIHYGILLRSLHKKGESPHVIMSGSEQSKLLTEVANRTSSDKGPAVRNPAPGAAAVDVMRAIDRLDLALKDARRCESVQSVVGLMRFVIDVIEEESETFRCPVSSGGEALACVAEQGSET
jgi:response regulator RpfG family c-di-GMP phosphodiesterase